MKPITRVWIFPSDSNPSTEYQTLLYADGSTSCNCMGWTRRTAQDGSRSCKYTRLVDMGRADTHCSASHTYHPQPIKPNAQTKIKTIRLGQRRIVV